MSANIGRFKPTGKDYHEGELTLTAFMGGKYGASIQFGIQTSSGYTFCRLGETQLEALIEIIAKRLNYEQGYTSTGKELKKSDKSIRAKRVKYEKN